MLTIEKTRTPISDAGIGIIDSFIVDSIVGDSVYSNDGVSMTLTPLGTKKLTPTVGSQYFLFTGGLLGSFSQDDFEVERLLNEKARYLRAHVAARRNAIEQKYWIRTIRLAERYHWIPAYPISILQVS